MISPTKFSEAKETSDVQPFWNVKPFRPQEILKSSTPLALDLRNSHKLTDLGYANFLKTACKYIINVMIYGMFALKSLSRSAKANRH